MDHRLAETRKHLRIIKDKEDEVLEKNQRLNEENSILKIQLGYYTENLENLFTEMFV
jgi:regulator of replication initiation timing